MILTGTKYYKYDEDQLQVYRVVNNKDDKYTLKELFGKGKRIVVEEEKLKSVYIKLNNDAFLNMMITASNGVANEDIKDVFACVNKVVDMQLDKLVPCLIVRQNCMSQSKNAFNTGIETYVGDCFTSKNIQLDMSMEEVMEYDEISYTYSVALYIDDTINDIFDSIPPHILEEFNKALKEIKSSNKSSLVKGYSLTLQDLFNDNNFMYNYRDIFGVVQLDFPIYLGKSSYNEDGDIVLNEKQHKKLEDRMYQYINIVAVLKYDRDIDVSKIVKYAHIVVSDSNGDIYLIAYQKIGDYKIDDDVLNAFNLVK
jgi:hypothetical protein